ncbi:MAG: nicotinamide mononucleotide transporter [Proteobacteria bacterium]|nr:nicotinamide mononucleotide transporter [Pseudomonadota bacterium]
MNWLDPVGAGLSLICTYYFTQARRFAWILGILAIMVNSLLYYQKGIYGSLVLEAIYFISMIYGLYQWSTPQKRLTTADIKFLTAKQFFVLCVIALGGFFVASFLLTKTGSDIPYWDALTTTLSLIAQAMLCLKIIHCWILWFIVDAMMAALQLYKGIPFHSAIHWSYLILAVIGYIRWHQLLKMQPMQTAKATQ